MKQGRKKILIYRIFLIISWIAASPTAPRNDGDKLMNTEKLKGIKARIKELKTPKFSNPKIRQEISPFTIAVDLVSGTMVGVVIGIFTDKFFNSKPLFLIIFTIIGMIAGFNIIMQKIRK